MPAPAKSFSRSFWVLLVAQLLGAANDNLLKGVLTFCVVDGLWSSRLGSGGQAIVFLVFTIPFLLFSGYGGPLADRTSKTSFAKFLKGLEVPIVGVCACAFYWENLWLALGGMFLLTTQSAFFGPVKYGMIPELVDKKHLTRANGLVNMTTNVAVVLATKLAGEVSDLYDPQASEIAGISWLPGVWLLGLAFMGWASTLFFSRLAPVAPNSTDKIGLFSVYRDVAGKMRRGPLGKTVLLWSLFYAVATFALLIIPEYAVVLQISRGHAADLLTIISVSIGIGSLGVGILSRNTMGVCFVPWAAGGMGLCFVALAVMTPSFGAVAVALAFAGLFAGAYIVPLQAKIQALAPDGDRGRFLGTANAFSFSVMAMAAIVYKSIRSTVGDAPYELFAVSAGTMALATLWMCRSPATLDDIDTRSS